MHWYVYPLAAFASVFLGHFLVDQVGQPIRSVLRLRRMALERMVLFQECGTTQAARTGDHVAGHP